jgi:hypothetical protein
VSSRWGAFESCRVGDDLQGPGSIPGLLIAIVDGKQFDGGVDMISAYANITEFQSELERRESLKADYVVSTPAITATDESVEFNGDLLRVLPTAHTQLAQWAGIPKKYYDRMIEVPGLRAHNLNAWFDKSNDTRMLRTMDGSLRAYLSDRYRTVDNLQVMDAAAPAFAQIPDLKVQAVNLSSDRMYVQFILPSLQGEIFPGDIVNAGICFTNSETGRGAVDVSMMVWRLVCSNGMVAASLLKKNHIGRRVGGDFEDYALYQ